MNIFKNKIKNGIGQEVRTDTLLAQLSEFNYRASLTYHKKTDEQILDTISIEVIERYLRKKKLQNINITNNE